MMNALDVVNAIDESYAQEPEVTAREYIGASVIGQECDAAIAFNLRGFPNVVPDPQLKRIFKLGHIVEDIVVEDLKRVAGLDVFENDPETGRQWSYKALGGHIACHTDGQVLWKNNRLILEIKSMNDASFRSFQSKKMQYSHPHYFAQIQMYMGMSGLTETLFVAYNKNRSKYHAEFVPFDEFEWSYIKHRIIVVLNNQAQKIATDRSDWRCKGCFKRDVCWGQVEPERKCSACAYAFPQVDGSWRCSRHDKPAQTLCDDYQQYRPLDRGL